METYKRPRSIKVIYWITQITFWMFALAVSAGALLALAFIFEFLDKSQLHVGVPIAIHVLEEGTVTINDTLVNTEFKEMYGKIHFIDTPSEVAKIYGFFMLVIISISLYIFQTFRTFISNVYNGQYFQRKNIMLLKRISYALLGAWIFTVFYAYYQYFTIIKNMNFTTIESSNDVQTYPILLIISLFIWVLSHIFLKGVELQDENKLTI